jgi:SAM-dependent methyltransferase
MDPTRLGVRRTYDRIAEHFALTREYPWPDVESFLADASGQTGIDVGCGNGRHLPVLADRVDRVVGVDASPRLLAVARDRVADRTAEPDRVAYCCGDAARLPVRSGTVDVGLYVATLHHLPDHETRVASLDDLARVLAPSGRALLSVWSVEHDRFDRETGFDTTVDWTLPDGEIVPRYYHVYDRAEFNTDLDASALSVHRSFCSSGNYYAIVGP